MLRTCITTWLVLSYSMRSRQGHLSLALTLTYVRRLFLATAPRLLTRVPNLATPQKSIIRPRIKYSLGSITEFEPRNNHVKGRRKEGWKRDSCLIEQELETLIRKHVVQQGSSLVQSSPCLKDGVKFCKWQESSISINKIYRVLSILGFETGNHQRLTCLPCTTRPSIGRNNVRASLGILGTLGLVGKYLRTLRWVVPSKQVEKRTVYFLHCFSAPIAVKIVERR